MKTFNTIKIIANAMIEILLTAIGLGLIGGFAYVLFTSGAIESAANLTTYMSEFSINSLPVQGLGIAVLAVAIFLHLIKTTAIDQTQMA